MLQKVTPSFKVYSISPGIFFPPCLSLAMRDEPKDSLNYRTIFHKIKVEYHETDTQTKLRKNGLEKEGGDCLDKRNVSRSRRQHAWRLFSLISQKCLQKKGKGNGLLGLKDKIQTF